METIECHPPPGRPPTLYPGCRIPLIHHGVTLEPKVHAVDASGGGVWCQHCRLKVVTDNRRIWCGCPESAPIPYEET